MKAILNVIWLLFGGIWLALGYAVAGVVCCLLIVTIPFGIASFRIANYALWPFGRTVVDRGGFTGPLSLLGNIIWLLLAGIWIAIGHVLTAIPMFVSIVGIPLGIANLKMLPISLMPLGKVIVPTDTWQITPYAGNAYRQSGYQGRVAPQQQWPS
ncbi:YccF domain-containing protein [Arthrobacter sp. zg-Y238]|uniref:YccF domain-containing protein n=1 Tax=Arthrobacter sp. zg-Y238 TaxID=2964614 RepID=UPI0021043484|nr:YccF domain-containing protein [Arthrobacter sp. zg-Y238]MCQ1952352.1 YccF domain-containing protein [Arthrobacter sp. zg-Y238]